MVLLTGCCVCSASSGPWTKNSSTFDNGYYTALVNKSWDAHVLDSTHTQWRRKDIDSSSLIMLNADMDMVW